MKERKLPTRVILNGIMLEAMKKETFFGSYIEQYLKELKRLNKIDQKQEKEIQEFFLIIPKIKGMAFPFSSDDFDFFIRKLFECYEIPNTEKIKLIYQGLKYSKIIEEQAKEIIRDFNLIEFHNSLIIEFEKSLK